MPPLFSQGPPPFKQAPWFLLQSGFTDLVFGTAPRCYKVTEAEGIIKPRCYVDVWVLRFHYVYFRCFARFILTLL